VTNGGLNRIVCRGGNFNTEEFCQVIKSCPGSSSSILLKINLRGYIRRPLLPLYNLPNFDWSQKVCKMEKLFLFWAAVTAVFRKQHIRTWMKYLWTAVISSGKLENNLE
jgi:hypothetical protein